MLQSDAYPRELEQPADRAGTMTRTFYLIMFPRELEDDVIEALEQLGLPGYTEFDKVTGRGPRGRHFDTAVWPGAEGSIFTVLGHEDGARLRVALAELSSQLESGSRGLYGLHLFAWACESVF
jgi:hypothetical protein